LGCIAATKGYNNKHDSTHGRQKITNSSVSFSSPFSLKMLDFASSLFFWAQQLQWNLGVHPATWVPYFFLTLPVLYISVW
jgi:hypothetical protein